ncbi:unnamed protein product [Didymodactylos carnosus]|nr:unnamed protein product [Didymodactylos carnosus]CAF3815298.1 unnamed protein product [Didymodactylos carnosus]
MISMKNYIFKFSLSLLLCLLFFERNSLYINSQFEWIEYDKIDEIMERINNVNSGNCFQKQPSELVLPEESVFQKPSIEMLKKDIIMRNRTQLLHVRNIAHRNALLYSYLFQRLFDFEEPGLTYILLHNVADVTGGLSLINGSGIFFDQDKYYPHWYKNYFNKTIPYFGPYAWRADDFYDAFNWKNEWTNQTIQEEDIGAGRNRQYTSRYNRGNEWYSKWLPDQTRNDQGRGKPVHTVQLYLAERMYKLRDMPENIEFYGPPHPEDPQGPTIWTKPYFDCGRSNKWIISAVSPIVDIYPRHTEYRHLQAMRNLGVAVTDVDFIMLDINQCEQNSMGNTQSNDPQSKSPNMFGGTDKCKETTRCEPLFGFGFRRGGYQCLCKPGYRYPPYQDGPFKGYVIEKATREEYATNFDCLRVDLYQQIPFNVFDSNVEIRASNSRRRRSINDENATNKPQLATDDDDNEDIRNIVDPTTETPSFAYFNQTKMPAISDSLFHVNPLTMLSSVSTYSTSVLKSSLVQLAYMSGQLVTGYDDDNNDNPNSNKNDNVKKRRSKRYAYERTPRVAAIFQLYDALQRDPNLCEKMTEDQLTLPGDVLYDIDVQFESQARLALTLSHFLSSFYQVVNPDEDFPLRKAELELTSEQLIGEVLAAAGADYKLQGVGIFFDVSSRGKFRNHHLPYFGPYAYRADSDVSRKYVVLDTAGLPDGYENEVWFKTMKARWATNADRSELREYWLKLLIRSDYVGNALVHHESGFPLYSYAPELKHGQWFPPVFQCNRNNTVPRSWIVTYAVPFFGLDVLGINLEFKGVVRVDAYLGYLDINQCQMPHYVPNAFKGSDRCDYQSTVCEPIMGRKFLLGKYKCRCRPGYEYPFLDQNDFFNGDQMNKEWDIMINNSSMWSRFDQLKCRIAVASSISSTNLILLTLTILFSLFIRMN